MYPWRVLALACVVVMGATRALAAEPDAATLARAAIERADRAMLTKDFATAAEAMEDAYRHDPNPLWLANAGYARMMAGEQDRAVENLSKALSDPRLVGDARDKAVERLAKASAARAHLARADEATTRGDFESAGRAYDSAFEQVPLAAYVLEAAIRWERAGSLDMAQARYEIAAARDGLNAQQRRQVAEALPRIAAARVRPAEPPVETEPPVTPLPPHDPTNTATLGWVLVATGVAATGLGVAGFILSDADEQEFRDNAFNAEGEIVMDPAEIEALESSATRWLNVGVVSSIVGGAAIATGLVLVLIDDEGPSTSGSAHVTGGIQPGGGFISALGRF